MKAEHHAVLGGIASGALVPVLGVNSVVFLASTVLVDFDHYLDYIYQNRFSDFSVRRMFRFEEILDEKSKDLPFLRLNIFHTIEFLLLVYGVAALTGLSSIEAVLWGLLFHMVLDWTYMYRHHSLFLRAFSIVEFIIRWSRLKSQGLHAELPYRLALEATFARPENVGKREDDPAR